MGKFFNSFKNNAKKIDSNMENMEAKEKHDYVNEKRFKDKRDKNKFDFYDDFGDDYYDEFTELQPAQKPESFHHFILENQYKDLEKSIRGYKDVWNKDTRTWTTKRKDIHCFTDEEAEDVLRTAQSHLATDIKLGLIKKDVFGMYMDALYRQISHIFESIAEYRYGRYGSEDKQYQMKLQNHKIFLELWTRIQANYSRSIEGYENKATHGSVKTQESLNQVDRLKDEMRGYT